MHKISIHAYKLFGYNLVLFGTLSTTHFYRTFMNLALETLDTYLFHYDFTSELAKALSFCVYRTTRHFESNYEGLANQYTSSDRKK